MWTGLKQEHPLAEIKKEKVWPSLEVVVLIASPSLPNSTPHCIQASQHVL